MIFKVLLISNFRHVLNAVCFLLGNSPAPEFYMPTFRNTVFSRLHRPLKMEQKECSETSSYKIQAPVNYPEESIQYSKCSQVQIFCVVMIILVYRQVTSVSTVTRARTGRSADHSWYEQEIFLCSKMPRWAPGTIHPPILP